MGLSAFLLCFLVAASVSAHDQTLQDAGVLDEWSDAMYIPNPDKGLPHNGRMSEFRFYARRTGTIYMQIWRRQSGTRVYKLILSEKVSVTSTGLQTAKVQSNAAVLKGDHVGFYFPGNSIIPFVGRECIEGRGLYRKNPSAAHLRIGAIVSFSENQEGWKPCRKYAVQAILNKGTMVGYESKDRRYMDEWTNAIYITDPKKSVQINGKLVSWEIFAKKTGTIYLQMYRPVESLYGKRFKLVGQTKVDVTETGYQLININPSEFIDVEGTDRIGFYFPGNSIIPFDGRECLFHRGLYHRNPSEVKVGTVYDFQTNQRGWNPCRMYSYAAFILEN